MGQILIDAVSKEYHDRRRQARNGRNVSSSTTGINLVLQNICLEFNEGEMVCILGPSGCGKSTLLRIIAGFEAPTTGRVLIDGKPLTQPSSDYIFVFQSNGLLPWMTVWENIELGLRQMEDRRSKAARIAEQIEMVELEGFERHYPYQLSGGMKRRAELARALAVNPNILILDEPFSGLDFLTHMKMREEVVNMHSFTQKTTLVVTHDIDDALIMGDRIVVMDGRPAKIELNHKLDFPRPRDFSQIPELNELRQRIFLMQGVHYAV